MRSPFFSDDEEPPRRRSPDSNLWNNFLTVPMALRVWLWNLIVIGIYLTFLYFAVHIGMALIAWSILIVTAIRQPLNTRTQISRTMTPKMQTER